MRDTLVLWWKHHGHTWRAKLRHAWDTGSYGTVDGIHPQTLQALRNIVGPSGLDGISTPTLVAWETCRADT